MTEAELEEAAMRGEIGTIAEAKAQSEIELMCEHVWKRLSGITSTGVKITECQLCGLTQEEDVS